MPHTVTLRNRLHKLPGHTFWEAVRYVAVQKYFKLLLKIVGLYGRGVRNVFDLQVRRLDVVLPKLPQSFDGFRILLMSDFHLGVLEGQAEAIAKVIAPLDADLCLLGGDYRFSFASPMEMLLDDFKFIFSKVRAPMGIYGVLGNHDCPETANHLQALGARVLVNASVPIHKNGETIYLAGTDDPHFHRRHDLDVSLEAVPKGAFVLLLTHSPDIYVEAADRGLDLYLCGHTHHGQVRLPGIGAPMKYCRVPKPQLAGLWRQGGMTGYTTAGVGASIVPVRFLCPPEVAILTLKCAAKAEDRQ